MAFPGVTHQGALGAPSSGTAARQLRGVQITLRSGARSGCGFPGGPRGDPRRAAASSPRAPVSLEGKRVESHPAPGGRAGGRGNPRRARDGAPGFLPGAATPGGHQGSLEPFTLLVWTHVNPPGRFPGGRGGRRAASRSQAGLAPGAPPPGGLPAGRGPLAALPGSRSGLAGASGTLRPGRRGPSGPAPSSPLPPPPPQAAPPPCQGRSKQETQDLTWRDPDFWPGFPLSR